MRPGSYVFYLELPEIRDPLHTSQIIFIIIIIDLFFLETDFGDFKLFSQTLRMITRTGMYDYLSLGVYRGSVNRNGRPLGEGRDFY